MARPSDLQRFLALACVLFTAIAGAQSLPGLLHDPPLNATVGEPLEFDVIVEPSPSFKQLIVRYRGPGGRFSDVPMVLAYGDLHRARIPAGKLTPPGIEYVIDAVLRDGRRIAAFPSNGRPLRIAVVSHGTRGASLREIDAAFAKADKYENAFRREAAIDEAFGEEEPEPPAEDTRDAQRVEKRNEAREERATAENVPEEQERAMATLPQPASSSSRRTAPLDALASQLEKELAAYAADDPYTRASRQDPTARRTTEFRSVITQEQIRARGARVLHQVLATVPGLSVSRDVQGFYRTGVRGLRDDAEVLFLLNGHRLNNFYDGRALASLPVENIERVEVTLGPGPAYYGLHAFRAVVHVITRREPGVRAALGAGSFNTFDGSISAAQDVGELRVFGDFDVRSQKGYSKEVELDVLAGETANQRLREATDPVGFTDDRRLLLNLGGGATWSPAGMGTLGVALRWIREDRGALVGMFDSVSKLQPDAEGSSLGWNVFGVDLRYLREFNDLLTLRVGLTGDFQSTSRRFLLTPKDFRIGEATLPDGAQERFDASVQTIGGIAALEVSFTDQHRLTVGTQIEQQALRRYGYTVNHAQNGAPLGSFQAPEGVTLPTELGGGAAAKRLALGLYVDDRWTLFEPLTLSLGMRLDAIELPVANANGEVTGTALTPSLNPRLALAFTVHPAVVLRMSYGRAFRAPTLAELADPVANTPFARGRFVGNPRLEPVMVDSAQLGADWVQAVGSGQLRLTGTAFAEQLSQPIIPVDNSLDTAMRNRDAVRIVGLEGEARIEISRRTSTFLNASFFRAEDLKTPTGLRLLTDLPQALLNAGVSMPIGAWVNFDLVFQAGAERRNNSRETLELLRRYSIAGYGLVTAQLRSEKIADHLVVTLTGQNVFDAQLVDDAARPDRMPGGVPLQGTSGFLTIRGEL